MIFLYAAIGLFLLLFLLAYKLILIIRNYRRICATLDQSYELLWERISYTIYKQQEDILTALHKRHASLDEKNDHIGTDKYVTQKINFIIRKNIERLDIPSRIIDMWRHSFAGRQGIRHATYIDKKIIYKIQSIYLSLHKDCDALISNMMRSCEDHHLYYDPRMGEENYKRYCFGCLKDSGFSPQFCDVAPDCQKEITLTLDREKYLIFCCFKDTRHLLNKNDIISKLHLKLKEGFDKFLLVSNVLPTRSAHLQSKLHSLPVIHHTKIVSFLQRCERKSG